MFQFNNFIFHYILFYLFSEFNKELEALKAIFLDELIEETIYQENKTDSECVTKFSVNLFPSTADKINEQYVKLTLNFTVPNKVIFFL